MRRVDYSQIVRGIVALTGQRGDEGSQVDGLSRQDWYAVRDVVDIALGEAWERDRWPEVTVIEERHLRRAWASGEAITTAAVERWYRGQYFQSLRASTGEAPLLAVGATEEVNEEYWAVSRLSYSGESFDAATDYGVADVVFYDVTEEFYQMHTNGPAGTLPTDTDYWGVLTEFDPVLEYEQLLAGGTAATKIGTVFAVWDRDPEKFKNAREYGFQLSGAGVQVPGIMPGTVWIEFRKRVPELKGDAYNSSSAYVAGDQVYFAVEGNPNYPGNFYNCVSAAIAGQSPSTHAAKWELVEIPARFKRYLVQAGIEGFLEGDGQVEKSVVKGTRAETLLGREVVRFRAQEGQSWRPRVQSY